MTVTVAALLAAKASNLEEKTSQQHQHLAAAGSISRQRSGSGDSSAASAPKSKSVISPSRLRMGRRKQNCPQKTGLGPEAGGKDLNSSSFTICIALLSFAWRRDRIKI